MRGERAWGWLAPRGAGWLASLVLLGLLAALQAGCKRGQAQGGGQAGQGRGGRGKGGGGKGLEYPVQVQAVESKKVEYVVSAPGTVEAFERVQVTARVAGVIDKVSFVEGGSVKKGDVLVTIESERYRLAVSQSKAAVAKAEATLADVNQGLARREAASKDNPGLIPGEEVESYRTKTRTAGADVSQTREALRVAQLNLRDSAVRAPMEGVIQTRTVETGQYVQAGAILATLIRRDPLLLRFQVTSMEAPRLKPGMKAQFSIRESAQPYEATITLVAAAADPASHMVSVTAEVTEKDRMYWLRPGTFCDVRVPIGDARERPVVPVAAVRPSEKGFVVFVAQEGVAKERIVKIGMHTADGQVEIREGLAAGEELVVRGFESLTDGVKVRVVAPGEEPGGGKGRRSAEPGASGSAAPGGSAAPAGSGRRGGRGRGQPAGSASGGAP